MRSKEKINSFLFTLLGFEKKKSTGYMLLVALLHVTGWCLLFFLPLFFYPVRINDNNLFLFLLIDKTLLVILFYCNYYILIPRLFEKKKYVMYFSLIALLFIVYFVQLVFVRTNYLPGPGRPLQFNQVMNAPDKKAATPLIFPPSQDTGRHTPPGDFPLHDPKVLGIPKSVIGMSINNAISSFALILFIGGFIRLSYSFIRNQNEKKALENATLNAEVNFLKSQINPHFLFNTLNGIYSQAHNKSEYTEHSILKLSDLLRYVLYDSGEKKVALEKDIQYIKNYIDLQKLRLSQKVIITYEVKGDINRKQIAPLLLITFVENAFKHGISYTNPSVITINISIFQETLTMIVTNPVIENNSFTGNGLGLKNAIRRLNLLYPSNYLLDIVHNDHLHSVNLKINLNSD